MYRFIFTLRTTLLCMLLCILPCIVGHAQSTNPTTGYRVELIDNANLLTDEEEAKLIEVMKPITAYGNVAFITNDYATYRGSAEECARESYLELFGTDSGTVFLIDMYTRYIWIHSDGEVYKTINTNYANTITDNAYKLATNKQYYNCAVKVFEQIITLLEGGRIAQPMKYICNAILGLIIALSLNFTWMAILAYCKRPKNKEILANIPHSFEYGVPRFKHTHTTKEKTSSGGGRHGGGFRGGGGVFRSGGGGGHRF